MGDHDGCEEGEGDHDGCEEGESIMMGVKRESGMDGKRRERVMGVKWV